MGLHRAGFDVTGVDIKPQPRYPFRFIQGDALNPPVRLEDFDLVWASPPCQHYSQATAWRGRREEHPDLIGPVQAMLRGSGVPYVIENVEAARRHLHAPVMLCGTMFGLPVRRHRFFETNWPLPILTTSCRHERADFAFDHGGGVMESTYRDGLGCDWMTVREARQSIPPAYSEWIGAHALGCGAGPAPNERKVVRPKTNEAKALEDTIDSEGTTEKEGEP